MRLIANTPVLALFVCLAAPSFGIAAQIDLEGWRFTVTDCQQVDRPQGPTSDGGKYILRCRVHAVNFTDRPRMIGLNWRSSGGRGPNVSAVNTVGEQYLFDEVWGYPVGAANGVRDADGRLALNVPARAATTFNVFVGDLRHQVRSLNFMNLWLRTSPTAQFRSPVLRLSFRDVPVERVTGRASSNKGNEAEQWNFRVRMGPK